MYTLTTLIMVVVEYCNIFIRYADIKVNICTQATEYAKRCLEEPMCVNLVKSF
jgi:hypothetical protein